MTGVMTGSSTGAASCCRRETANRMLVRISLQMGRPAGFPAARPVRLPTIRPSSATRGLLDPHVGMMIRLPGVMAWAGAPLKPSSLKLQFSPDAMIVGGGGAGGTGGPDAVGVVEDPPPHPTRPIARLGMYPSTRREDVAFRCQSSGRRDCRAAIVLMPSEFRIWVGRVDATSPRRSDLIALLIDRKKFHQTLRQPRRLFLWNPMAAFGSEVARQPRRASTELIDDVLVQAGIGSPN